MVDIPNRNVVLLVPAGHRYEFNLNPNCRIVLNGETVRLRLLLTGDEVEVAYNESDGRMFASSITVQTRQRVRV